MTNIMLTMASRGMKQAKDRETFADYHTKMCALYDSMGMAEKPETPTRSETGFAEIVMARVIEAQAQGMDVRTTLHPSTRSSP
jgi:hypothetical protein